MGGDINTLDEEASYYFTNVPINEFHQDEYFTFATDLSIKQIEDIGDVANNDNQQYNNTTVLGITSLFWVLKPTRTSNSS